MIDHIAHRVKHLEDEHQVINKKIDGLESTGVFDDTVLEVLKKQRLHLKDEIVKLKLKLAYEAGEQEND